MSSRAVTPDITIQKYENSDKLDILITAPSLQELTSNEIYWIVKDVNPVNIGLKVIKEFNCKKYSFCIPQEIHSEININCIRQLKKQIFKNEGPGITVQCRQI